LFASAVDDFKLRKRNPEIVRVYEKIFSGVWSEKGFFHLVNYKYMNELNRKVFHFFLEEKEIDINTGGLIENKLRQRTRVIPSDIKKIVWERDNGCCVLCGSSDELHFDHDLPYSKGGASITPHNVRILCARHNLQKSDKIE
jgi:hypothetical protein